MYLLVCDNCNDKQYAGQTITEKIANAISDRKYLQLTIDEDVYHFCSYECLLGIWRAATC